MKPFRALLPRLGGIPWLPSFLLIWDACSALLFFTIKKKKISWRAVYAMAGNFVLSVNISVYLLLSWVRLQAEFSLRPQQVRSWAVHGAQPLGRSPLWISKACTQPQVPATRLQKLQQIGYFLSRCQERDGGWSFSGYILCNSLGQCWPIKV